MRLSVWVNEAEVIVNEAEDRHFRDGPLTGSSTDNAASDQWIKMIEKIRQMETNLTQFPVENTAQRIKRQSQLQSTNNAPVYETKHKNQFCIKCSYHRQRYSLL